MDDVVNSKLSVLRAVKNHGVPKSNLHDRKSNNGVKPGPKPAAEESEFANCLVEVSQAGYRKEVKLLVVLSLTKE